MPAHQVLDLPTMCMVGSVGLFLGGLISYFANILLYNEALIFYPQTKVYCGHKGHISEAVPLLPFFLVYRSCKYCQRRVKWQYPLAEVFLAVAFLVLSWHFGLSFHTAGLMFFVGVLLAVCITDFRTKIIPHEITYPAILIGIIFSIITNADVIGCLAGIGVSYILFDFLAFYGLQIFTWFNKPILPPVQQFISTERKNLAERQKLKTKGHSWLSRESQLRSIVAAKTENITPKLYCKGIPIEELEIIGGGDAVLSALIAAWLGWQKLITAVILGFLVGTIIGAIYVLIELGKERLLKSIIVPMATCAIGLSVLAICILRMLAGSMNQSASDTPYLYVLPLAALSGCLLGVIIAGSKLSKPFPFGPALAIGALISIFR